METPAPTPPPPPDAPAPPPGAPDRAERRAARWLFALALAAGAALRLHQALTDDGIYWPDEIYQSFEQAHRLVFGYGLVPWEFVQGARNWTFAGVVAALLWAVQALGLDQPATYVPAVKAVFAAVGLATGWATLRLARASGASELAASAAAATFLLVAPAVYFAPRAMSETASALPAIAGLAIGLPARGRRWVALAAALLGFAVLLRLQVAALAAGWLGVLLARRRFGDAALAAGVLAGFAALYGLIDWLTWGDPFHSAIVYLRFNVAEGRGAMWGTSGAGYYLATLFSSMPSAAVPLALLALVGARRAWAPLSLAALFVAVHSLIPHKEYRFIFAALPLWMAAAAAGIDVLAARLPRVVVAAALVAGAAGSAALYRSMQFGELGQYGDLKPRASAFDDFGHVNRLLERAGQAPDLCGLKVEVVHLAWSGGYTYLHRRVPLYPHNGPPRGARRFNYVITAGPGAAGGGEVIASDRGVLLVRFPWPCEPDLGYSWRLP